MEVVDCYREKMPRAPFHGYPSGHVDVMPGLEGLDLMELPIAAAGEMRFMSPLPSTRSRASTASASSLRSSCSGASGRSCSSSSAACPGLGPSLRRPRTKSGQEKAASHPCSPLLVAHPCSPLLVARPSVATDWHKCAANKRSSFCRAQLIRANACRFADRYSLTASEPVLGEGTFGRVFPCVDKLADMPRAVKRIRLPRDAQKEELVNEVDALIALDHPAIVRLIEYFVEDEEVLLVMELLRGPSLGDRMQELHRFPEDFAVRCLKHMLKALFCCHCRGLAHNDVSPENFRFQTDSPDATLKMVDFGLSEQSSKESRDPDAQFDRAQYVQKRDIWSLGTIFFEMLTGERLFPESTDVNRNLLQATNPAFVPSRLYGLEGRGISVEAIGLLRLMLDPSTERRVSAQEALGHPLITRTYAAPFFWAPSTEAVEDGGGGSASSNCGLAAALSSTVPAMREFADSPRLRRVAMLVVAHLLDHTQVDSICRTFRFLARDGWRIEERRLRESLEEAGLEVPEDLGRLFECADVAGSGGLDYVEFLAVAITAAPDVYCRGPVLKAAFHFLDAIGAGVVDGRAVHALDTERPLADCVAMIQEACGEDAMTLAAFERMMVPRGWEGGCFGDRAAAREPSDEDDEASPEDAAAAAHAAAAATAAACGSGSTPSTGSGAATGGKGAAADGPPAPRRCVTSAPSQAFAIRQAPGFHRSALRPYYERQPISNVVLGIARGTSPYARRAVAAGCAEVVSTGSEETGAFFFMPNPKYHDTPEVPKPIQRMRIVAWWIHPALYPELRDWVAECEGAGADPACSSSSSPTAGGLGAPGDFGYSDVSKPDGYLHSCRDLAGEAHVRMIDALVHGTRRFLGRLLGAGLPEAHVSAGFHYPVRPQYSTLHLQIRVNSGDVCPGEGRGVDLFRLRQRLIEDPEVLARDDEQLFYEATANLRNALLAASAQAGTPVKEVGPHSLVLGPN